MNPFEIFSTEEINKVSEVTGTIENRDYTKEEWNSIENKLFDDIMSKSSKNGDIDKARNEFNSALNKIESVRMKCNG